MQTYIGTKLISARPMTRGDYNAYCSWDTLPGENPFDAGYLVEYLDGSDSNHPDHEGYISWSPDAVFERSYKPIDRLTFGQAVTALKCGHKVAREGWNGKGMFLFLVPGSQFQVNRAPLLGIYPEGTTINYQPHIDMKTAQDTVVPWLASQSDILAEDWVLV